MWQQIDNSIWVTDYVIPKFPICRAAMFKMADDSMLVYSPPVPSGDHQDSEPAIISEAKKLGDVQHLLVPSNFHTMGMSVWKQYCPEATLYAELSTSKRMKKFGLAFTDWRQLNTILPDGVTMDVAPLKFGEIWIHWPADLSTLIVCEGFFNIAAGKVTGANKLFFKLFDSAPGLKMSRVVKLMQTRPKTHGQWARDFIRTHAPTRLIPAHGDIVEAPDLTDQLIAVVDARLGQAAAR